ncbi:MAG: M81 family metallopeptidase, partial [Gammaproteobacteria bacterium]|nr:M81 family metallopeptidase [Gammaproteobacteria bacterium]
MRIGIAGMSHETNTFSPVITDLKRFSSAEDQPPSGERALKIFRGTGTCVGGFIALCERRGYGFELGIAAGAAPSGPVENDA